MKTKKETGINGKRLSIPNQRSKHHTCYRGWMDRQYILNTIKKVIIW